MSNKVKVVVNEEKISETPTVLVGASDKPDQLSPNPAHSGFTKQLFVNSLPDTGEPNVIYCVAIKTGPEQAVVGYRNYKWDLEHKKYERVFDNDPALKLLQGPQGVEVNEVNPPKKAPEKVFEGEVVFKEEPTIKGKKLHEWIDSEGGVTQEELDTALALKQDKLDTESAPSGVVVKLLGFNSEGEVVNDDVPEGIVVDDSLDIESNNAIANKPVAEKFAQVDEELEKKANVDGNYPTLTAGLADNLNTKIVQNEKEAYLFRTTGGSLEVGNNCKEKAIVGGSIAFNQLGKELINSNWSKQNITATYTDGVATLVATAQNGNLSQQAIPIPSGHKLFFSCKVKLTTATTQVQVGPRIKYKNTSATTEWQTIQSVTSATPNDSGNIFIIIVDGRSADWDEIQFKEPMLIDLTAMFGSTIADYIYSLEQGEAGAGVAWFKRYFNKPYYPYTPIGAFINVKTSGKKVVGFNQCNENWVIDSQYNATVKSDRIPVLPNTTYYGEYFDLPAGANACYFAEYDADGNMIDSHNAIVYKKITFTTSANASYVIPQVNFSSPASVPVSFKTNFNFHYDGERDGEYEPYETETYSNDNIELIGIPHIDAQGNLYYEGNIYRPDGTVERKFASYTFTGEENITDGDGNTYIQLIINSYAADIKNETDAQAIMSSFEHVNWGGGEGGWTGKTMVFAFLKSGNSLNMRVIGATNISDLTGKTLIYELATPTEDSATPYPENQPCNNWGTEERIDNREVPIPVGHDTDYPLDLKSKLEILPNLPSDDGVYVAEVESGTAQYIPLATYLQNNGYTKDISKQAILESIGGALRQVLCLKETLDFEDTGSVDLGELTWTYSTLDGNPAFTATISGAKTTSKTISTRYEKQDGYQTTNKTYTLQRGEPGTIWVIDNSYTDAVAFKAAVQGVIVAFEKA